MTLEKGDLFVVPGNVNHRVFSSEECLIMLIETKTTEHTGNVKSSITRSINEQMY
jgi:mannose-6-phosphate isomerase-like protein (cupin superfamily)